MSVMTKYSWKNKQNIKLKTLYENVLPVLYFDISDTIKLNANNTWFHVKANEDINI